MCLLFFVKYANIFIFSDVCFFDILFAAVGQYFVQILKLKIQFVKSLCYTKHENAKQTV